MSSADNLARVPLIGWAGPETVCHCLEQAVQRPTPHRERRCLSHGHTRGTVGSTWMMTSALPGQAAALDHGQSSARRQPAADRIVVNILGEKVSMTRLVVASDLFPPPDRPCVIRHGAILPLDSHSSQPRLAPLDSTRRPQSPRSPSLLLADVRVLFVNHGRIGTACSKQWHTGPAGVGATEAGTQSAAGPTRKPMAFPHRTDLGKRPCPCSFRAAPHCLFQALAHGFGSRPAGQGRALAPLECGDSSPLWPMWKTQREVRGALRAALAGRTKAAMNCRTPKNRPGSDVAREGRPSGNQDFRSSRTSRRGAV